MTATALRPALLAALLGTALLAAGCKKAPEPEPANVEIEAPVVNDVIPPEAVPEPEPEAKPVANEATKTVVAEPSDDEQLLLDAEATGMTSRSRPVAAPPAALPGNGDSTDTSRE